MPRKKIENIVLKLPTGTPPPSSEYKLSYKMKGFDLYVKPIEKITKTEMDEVTALFGAFGMSPDQAVKQCALAVIDEDGLAGVINSFSKNCSVSGGYQKKTRGRKLRRTIKRRKGYNRRSRTRKH